ncbi:MAG TPA: hypothetical protein VJM53_10915 [Burkholderiales bacterium]|nr:hypothetical protein [Burkholderiales bacterium]
MDTVRSSQAKCIMSHQFETSLPQHSAIQVEEWTFYSQLGRIFDAFTELQAITPQSAQSEADYLFPQCELNQGESAQMNDIVAQLLTPFVNAWMDGAGLLRRTYRWDDPLLSNFSNRATLAQMKRSSGEYALAA